MNAKSEHPYHQNLCRHMATVHQINFPINHKGDEFLSINTSLSTGLKQSQGDKVDKSKYIPLQLTASSNTLAFELLKQNPETKVAVLGYDMQPPLVYISKKTGEPSVSQRGRITKVYLLMDKDGKQLFRDAKFTKQSQSMLVENNQEQPSKDRTEVNQLTQAQEFDDNIPF